MPAAIQFIRTLFFLSIVSLPLAGCGSNSSVLDPSTDQAVQTSASPAAQAKTPPPTQGETPMEALSPSDTAAADWTEVLMADEATRPVDPIEPIPSQPTIPTDSFNLPGNLTPARLTEFLQMTDLEMQQVANRVNAGVVTQIRGDAEMFRISKLKLQAAIELLAAPNADEKQNVIGIRGQLQALSHLAAMGDLKSAQQLETLANEQVTSTDVSIAEDSRLVLIGLALERIQNGAAKDTGEVITQIQQLGSNGRTPSIAAMMVLGQARVVLEKYGFTNDATLVRNQIVDQFATHPDPNVASMALQMAGTPRFAEVDQMLRSLAKGDPVTTETWRMTVNSLLAESPDLSAVQFLAGAALEAEAAGRDDLVSATYEALQATKTLSAAAEQEVKVAFAARQVRKSIVGQQVSLDWPSTDGRPLSISSYTGRIVLMPFWTISYPESLSILQLLDQIRANSDGQVEIVGMNLDVADAPVDQFLAQSPVQFQSFLCETKPNVEPANQAAAQFGVVSMPFVVVVGRDGHVAAIDFTGQRLQETVAGLLDPNAAK